ncbi:MAG: hypothetical protein E7C72_06885 [Dialister sp.]|nr:hypothetical protein [Dialister sp.]
MILKEKIDCLRERRIRHRIIAKSVFNTRILCPDSYRSRWSGMAFHSLAITSFKNDRPDIYCRSVKTVFLFLLILAPSDGSAACGLYPFLLRQKVIQHHIETQFTPAVILERRAESE